jgi:hypothetical protein
MRTVEEKFELVLGDALLRGQPQGGEDAGDDDGCSALDVIVEDRSRITALVQEPRRIRVGEVLELVLQQDRATPSGLRRGEELRDQRFVGRAALTTLTKAGVELVVEVGLVLRSDIQHHGKAEARVDSSQCRVQHQLPDRNSYQANTEIRISDRFCGAARSPKKFLTDLVHTLPDHRVPGCALDGGFTFRQREREGGWSIQTNHSIEKDIIALKRRKYRMQTLSLRCTKRWKPFASQRPSARHLTRTLSSRQARS